MVPADQEQTTGVYNFASTNLGPKLDGPKNEVLMFVDVESKTVFGILSRETRPTTTNLWLLRSSKSTQFDALPIEGQNLPGLRSHATNFRQRMPHDC